MSTETPSQTANAADPAQPRGGASVREVVEMIGEVTGMDATPDIKPRRAGDPPKLIAKPDRIKDQLGWTGTYDLRDMVESAWAAWRADH